MLDFMKTLTSANWAKNLRCVVFNIKMKCLRNTTNLRNHVSPFHPESLPSMLAVAKKTADPAHPRTDATLPTLPPNMEKGKIITQSVAAFIGFVFFYRIYGITLLTTPGFVTC